MGRLQGKSAIVTGAASGIGRASAISFASEGASLVIADKAEAVHETAALIAKTGAKVVALTGDAADETFVESLVKRAVTDYGKLDVFYANAGIIGPYVSLTDIDAAGVAELLRVNLIGPMLAVKHAAKAMIPNGKGSIICTASVAGIRSGAGPAPYSASKAGVINLATTAANEFYGTGIRVNAICPGLIETGMTKPIFDQSRARGTDGKIGQLNPLNRYGVPNEIAQMALFLASDDASYVNGQAIAVDGGLSSSHPVVRAKR